MSSTSDQPQTQPHHEPLVCPFHDQMGSRMDRVEHALYGNPADPKSTAVLPTLARVSAYLDAACWAWRAVLAAGPASAAVFAFGKGMGWW
jgi:hypothetical protein